MQHRLKNPLGWLCCSISICSVKAWRRAAAAGVKAESSKNWVRFERNIFFSVRCVREATRGAGSPSSLDLTRTSLRMSQLQRRFHQSYIYQRSHYIPLQCSPVWRVMGTLPNRLDRSQYDVVKTIYSSLHRFWRLLTFPDKNETAHPHRGI